MLFDEADEIRRRVARHRRLGEVGIGGEEVFRRAMNIGEVAAASSGDENFLSEPIGMIQHGDATSALAGFDGTHKPCRATAENECVEMMNHPRQPTAFSESPAVSRAGPGF